MCSMFDLSRASFFLRFHRFAIANFAVAQMEIDKNGKIGRKQLRSRSDFFLLNKQGASVASFFGKNRRLLPSTR